MPHPFGKPCAAANCHPERSRRISQRTADYPPSHEAPADRLRETTAGKQDGGQAADVADSFPVIRSEVEKISLLALIVCDTDLR